MSSPEEQKNRAIRLRQRAEDALRGKPVNLADLPIEDIQELIHELQVHQMELTLQNEELRRVQQELETTRDQFSDLYNFAPVGYCTLDQKGHISEANLTLAVLLGVKQDMLLHKKLSDFVAYEDQDAYYLNYQQAFADHQRQVVDIQMAKQSGEQMIVRLESIIDHENPNSIRVILSDITQRKQAEKALARYAQELERANQELLDFSFIVSHDLQEPLRKVKSFGEMLKTYFGETLGSEGNDYIARMMAATARMDSMLHGLLAYSRVTSQGEPSVDVNLQQIVLEVLSDLEVRLAQTGGKVVIGELPIISADPLQMRQLFQNLIGNALKYHRPGVPPLVNVTSKLIEKKKLEITVTDNGIGFDMQYADHILKPFTRLHGRPDVDGTGMGLAICKKIVERHNGTIAVSSILNQGSTFTITISL